MCCMQWLPARKMHIDICCIPIGIVFQHMTDEFIISVKDQCSCKLQIVAVVALLNVQYILNWCAKWVTIVYICTPKRLFFHACFFWHINCVHYHNSNMLMSFQFKLWYCSLLTKTIDINYKQRGEGLDHYICYTQS